MKILLLAGGDSNEREVSLASSAAIYRSLIATGHEVAAVDSSTGANLVGAEGRFLTDGTPSDSKPTTPAVLLPDLFRSASDDVDVVFIGLHGGEGENGSIQNLLALAGKPFVGSDAAASAVAMNKALTKHICRSLGIPTAEWMQRRFAGEGISSDLHEEILARFELPFIVKPNDGGSTVGLTKVEAEDQLNDALLTALSETSDVLVEDYIPGRELTVTVLDGESLPVVEIVPKSGLYDYQAKYTSGMSEYICPADIPEELEQQLKIAAVRLYETIGAWGAARIDFRVPSDDEYYCLELNTLPGMTELSLVPMAAAAAGISFDQLMERLLQSALNQSQR